jgi:cytochrome c-type biogenesis protein CcmH
MTDTAVPSGAQSQLAAPGPTAEQAQAASTMAPADRQAMIAGMVARLAEKMKANPRDQEGWVRLMRAYMVQGETDKARTAYQTALAVFSDSKPDQSALKAAAKGLGIPGA